MQHPAIEDTFGKIGLAQHRSVGCARIGPGGVLRGRRIAG
jgi:hypothetical protein